MDRCQAHYNRALILNVRHTRLNIECLVLKFKITPPGCECLSWQGIFFILGLPEEDLSFQVSGVSASNCWKESVVCGRRA